jgi:hypothetical protein
MMQQTVQPEVGKTRVTFLEAAKAADFNDPNWGSLGFGKGTTFVVPRTVEDFKVVPLMAVIYKGFDQLTATAKSGGAPVVQGSQTYIGAWGDAVYTYVDKLETKNRTLEGRVSLLENELSSVRPYLKTLNAMISDNAAAATRVDVIVRTLTGKSTSLLDEDPIEWARREDTLETPLEFNPDEEW